MLLVKRAPLARRTMTRSWTATQNLYDLGFSVCRSCQTLRGHKSLADVDALNRSTGIFCKSRKESLSSKLKSKRPCSRSIVLEARDLSMNNSPKNNLLSVLEQRELQLLDKECNNNQGAIRSSTTPDTVKTQQAKHKHKKTENRIDIKNGRTLLDLGKTDDPITKSRIDLRAYLEVSIFCGLLDHADRTFTRNTLTPNMLNTDICNIMLNGWADHYRLDKVSEVFETMSRLDIKPDIYSYSASLKAMGRCTHDQHNSLKHLLADMELNGITVDAILEKCVVNAEETNDILKAVHLVRPDFVPTKAQPLQQESENQLLKKLKSNTEDYKQSGNGDRGGSQYSGLFSREELDQLIDRQFEIELAQDITLPSVDTLQGEDRQTLQARKHLLRQYQGEWRKALLTAILEYKQSKSTARTNLYPFFCLLRPEEYVSIMEDAVHSVANTVDGEPIKVLAGRMGLKVYHKYVMRRMLQSGHDRKIKTLYKDYADFILNDHLVSTHQLRDYWQLLERKLNFNIHNLKIVPWSFSTLLNIGSFMATMICERVKIDTNIVKIPGRKRKLIPALYNFYIYRSYKTWNFLKPHPLLVQLLKASEEVKFEAQELPMLCPPVPWCTPSNGGFLLSNAKLMRDITDQPRCQTLAQSVPSSRLAPVFNSLNYVGSVPWVINQPVMDIMTHVFKNKGDRHLDIAQPASEAPPYPALPPTTDIDNFQEVYNKIRKDRLLVRKTMMEMHSLRVDLNYKLSIAHKYRDSIMWFPHNLDFRGRAYTIQPHLHHLGSDVVRSLLKFARGKPLGPHGLDWLKIHLVNLTGTKKRCSIQERLDYANEMIEEILDSANHPLNGRKWWQESDEPWQTLACCIEIASALKLPDPAKYINHVPVHQDGSCNGLQHYAALGRDVVGARQVNLDPADRPQDVYSAVAGMVEQLRQEDAAEGLEIARLLKGHIQRKVVKQTVMTVVYGVTRYGGRQQIRRQLRDRDGFPTEHVWQGGAYLVEKVFQSLRSMFNKSREIQDWLTDCSKKISKRGMLVQWVTPLGLPVVQPYSKSSEGTEVPDIIKQRNAFPPNFIHSLDSTHMMLTALYCQKAGITFVSVHDCFWTHACSVNTMNKVCREQFVALHSQPVLEKLSEFLLELSDNTNAEKLEKSKAKVAQFDDLRKTVAMVPSKGEFDLQNVLASTYFFS